MEILITRVNKAKVKVGRKIAAFINNGIVAFVGFCRGDDGSKLTSAAKRIANLRIFENDAGKMFYSVKDKGYSILCVPNFTLCANVSNSRRPSFDNAIPYGKAKSMFNKFAEALRSEGIDVREGLFGADMDIDVEMDGPVNIMLKI